MAAAIKNLKLTPGDGMLHVTWSYSGTGANAVEVKWRPTVSGLDWVHASRVQVPTSQTSADLIGLTDGVSYDVRVVPVQYSPYSQTASAVPLAPLPPPPSASGVARFHRCADSYSGTDFSAATVAGDAPRRDLLIVATAAAGGSAYKAANPAVDVLAYKDLMYVNTTIPSPGSDPANNCGVSWADAQAHPDWLLLDADGNKISGGGNRYLLDPGNGSYQQAFTANVLTQLKSEGFAGLFLDDCNRHWFGAQGNPAKYPTDTAWMAATRSFMAAMETALHAAGYLFYANIGGFNAGTQVALYDWVTLVDGWMIEGWMRPSTTPSDPLANLSSGWWLQQLGWIARSEASGKHVLAQLPATTTDRAAILYALTTLLLVAGGLSSLDVMGSDKGNYTQAIWTPDYDAALALDAPLGAYYTVNGGQVYRRDFEHGSVLVNPSANNQTVIVARQTVALQPSTGLIVSAP